MREKLSNIARPLGGIGNHDLPVLHRDDHEGSGAVECEGGVVEIGDAQRDVLPVLTVYFSNMGQAGLECAVEFGFGDDVVAEQKRDRLPGKTLGKMDLEATDRNDPPKLANAV